MLKLKDISPLHADHDGIRPDHDDVHPILIDGSFLCARDEYWRLEQQFTVSSTLDEECNPCQYLVD